MDFSPITLPIANLHHDICQFAPLSGQAGYNAACSYFTYYKETDSRYVLDKDCMF